ncbi:hypothetical protein HMPREF9440_02284, partial [Sutterella parvirubra YIT 11816]
TSGVARIGSTKRQSTMIRRMAWKMAKRMGGVGRSCTVSGGLFRRRGGSSKGGGSQSGPRRNFTEASSRTPRGMPLKMFANASANGV